MVFLQSIQLQEMLFRVHMLLWDKTTWIKLIGYGLEYFKLLENCTGDYKGTNPQDDVSGTSTFFLLEKGK